MWENSARMMSTNRHVGSFVGFFIFDFLRALKKIVFVFFIGKTKKPKNKIKLSKHFLGS